MAKEYFRAYTGYLEQLEPYSDAEVGRIYRACLRYSMDGTLPEFTGNERFLWASLRQDIDRDKEAYEEYCERQRANGSKGGRPKKPTGFSENPENPLVFPETQKTQGLLFSSSPLDSPPSSPPDPRITPPYNPPINSLSNRATSRFAKPTRDEVREYCRSRNNGVNADQFVDFYESKGWMIGKNPMKDWKAAVRTWERKDGKRQTVSVQPMDGKAEMEEMRRFLDSMEG